ncbi:hypothetical protein [Actinoallomurus sp. CA-150999]|uniref:hypothetical protein n=1 Tax=Actinoallomurus sp. CA-150999 TaxID=3239887 RepID=UPI003D8DC10D
MSCPAERGYRLAAIVFRPLWPLSGGFGVMGWALAVREQRLGIARTFPQRAVEIVEQMPLDETARVKVGGVEVGVLRPEPGARGETVVVVPLRLRRPGHSDK